MASFRRHLSHIRERPAPPILSLNSTETHRSPAPAQAEGLEKESDLCPRGSGIVWEARPGRSLYKATGPITADTPGLGREMGPLRLRGVFRWVRGPPRVKKPRKNSS